MQRTRQYQQDIIVIEDEALRAGFTQIPNLVLRRPDVTTGAKLTYMVLLSYAWQQGSCFPGQETLAHDMGVSKRSIITYLQQLQDTGLLRVRRRGLGQTNIYSLPRLSDSNLATPRSRSEKSALLQVKKSTHLEVQNLHRKKTQIDQDSDQEDTAITSNTPDSVRLFRSAHAHENVENSDHRLDNRNGKGGRPEGRRPQNPITPSRSSSYHDVPHRLADPTGGEASRRDPEAQPVAGPSRRGSPGGLHAAADAAFHASAVRPTIAGVDPMQAARTSQHRGTSRDTDASAETVSQATMPHGVASIGSVLAGRGEAQTIATRREGPKMGRIAVEGAEIPDHPKTPSESHPGRATGPSQGRRRIVVPDYIKHVVTDFSAELHDDEHTRANLSRATRLWQHSGLEEPVFVQEVLYKARAITRKQSGVKKRSAVGGTINRMPYFFAVVEDLLGLKERPRTVVESR